MSALIGLVAVAVAVLVYRAYWRWEKRRNARRPVLDMRTGQWMPRAEWDARIARRRRANGSH